MVAAFVAGLISFLSPCVLPLIPGYVSFISGVSLEDLTGPPVQKKRHAVILSALLFVLGFSLIFVSMGASATWVGALLTNRMGLLSKLAGAFIMFFGLVKMGVLPVAVLQRQLSFKGPGKGGGLLGAPVVGASFAFGWTPCVGPILAAVLTYAGTLEKAGQGMALLAVYALGMGIPFMLTALAVNGFFRLFTRIRRHLGWIERATGLVMVLLGLMIFFNKLILLPGYLPFLSRFSL